MSPPTRILARRASATALLLILVIAGFVGIYTGRAYHDRNVERAGYTVAIAAMVVAAGASACLLFISWRREDRERAQRKKPRPDEPWWWWRADWADGFARDESTIALDRDWLTANLLLALSTLLLLAAGPAWNDEEPLQKNKGKRPYVVALSVAVTGAAMAFTGRTVRRTMRLLRKGSSLCRFERIPIWPGETFRVTIELPLDAPPKDGIVVTMECHYVFLQSVSSREHIGSRRYARGAPGRPATRLWPELYSEQTVFHNAVRVGGGIQVPVSLQIPRKVEVRSARFDPGGTLEWSLKVSARGAPSARFTLPVYPNDVPLY